MRYVEAVQISGKIHPVRIGFETMYINNVNMVGDRLFFQGFMTSKLLHKEVESVC